MTQVKPKTITTVETSYPKPVVWTVVVSTFAALILGVAIIAKDPWNNHFQENLAEIKLTVGLLLIGLGVLLAGIGLVAKTTKTETKTAEAGSDAEVREMIAAAPALPAAGLSAISGLVDKAGGVGVLMVVIGALLLGVTFDTDSDDAAASGSATASVTPLATAISP